MKTRAAVTAVVVMLVAVPGSSAARAQDWSLDVSLGRVAFRPVPGAAGVVDAAGRPDHLTVGFRRERRPDFWFYGTVAAPLIESALRWGTGGGGGRVRLHGSARTALGVDVGAHVFGFRDPVGQAGGSGGVVEAMPVATVQAGAARVELRGGWRGYGLSYAGTALRRAVLEVGTTVRSGGPLQVQVEGRWVSAREGSYPFGGVSLVYARRSLAVWTDAGKWLDADLDDVTWSVGAGHALGARTSAWVIVRQDAPDPLYWNIPRRTWSVGVTRRFGRAAAPAAPLPQTSPGLTVIRVAVEDALATPELFIAGSFTHWQAQPMTREGDDWVIRLPLETGIHEYAFRTADGEWFVPASTPGRRDDGMGGHVARLVVP